MRRTRRTGPDRALRAEQAGVTVLALCFLLGTLAGCGLAGGMSGTECSALQAYLNDYLAAVRGDGASAPPLAQSMWQTLRWPVLTVLLSLTAVRRVGIPLLFGVRGFLLAFAVAVFIRTLGAVGAALALLLFGLPGCAALPALFLLGMWGMTTQAQTGRSAQKEGGMPWLGVSAGALAVSICLERSVVPGLLGTLAGRV